MLEILIPGIRQGQGVIAGSTVYRGMFCYISAINSTGEAILRVPYSSPQAWGAVYPVNKLYYPADYGDTSAAIDKIPSGSGCIYYEGGEYETDQWYPSAFGLTCAYWATLENYSSSYGSAINIPGTSTTLSTLGVRKGYVSAVLTHAPGSARYSLGSKQGQLVGFASAAGFSLGTYQADNGWVADIVAIHGSSSADARIRFRIPYSKIGRAAWGGTDIPALP